MDHLSLFCTDVFVFRPPNAETLNPPLLQAILDERSREPGVSASQVGGWHSRPDIAQRTGPPYRPVMETIVDRVGQVLHRLAAQRGQPVPSHRWSVEAWSIVLERGGYSQPHHHRPSHFSVAWYVDAGEPPSEAHPLSGAFSLLDPRGQVGRVQGLDLWPPTLDIHPESGMLLIFPGWALHHVHPYAGERPRVVVSANLRIAPV